MRAFLFLYLFCFAAGSILICSSEASVAAGFGVSPSTLDFTVEKGSEASRQLIIYNTGQAAEFNAVSSNPELISVYPSSGAISEEGTKRLAVTVFGKNEGVAYEHIVISMNPRMSMAGDISLSLGTNIAAKVHVIESAARYANFLVGILLSAGIIIAGLLAYLSIRGIVRQPLRILSKRA